MALVATPDKASAGNTPLEEEDFLIADDLLQARAADRIQIPLLCFSKTERDVTDYESFTGSDIDRFVDHAARYYSTCGVKPPGSSYEEPKVIALLAPTDLAYMVTFFSLARLGYAILCLSHRLAPDACAKLIRETGAIAVIPGKSAQLATLVAQTQKIQRIEIISMICREDFDMHLPSEARFQRENIDRETEKSWILAILHSSGSTGLPKPIYIPHRRLMMKVPAPKSQVEFNTFPFNHGYGSWAVVNGIMARKTVYMNNPRVPMTASYVVEVLEHIRPDVLHVVPYTVELLAQSERGIDAMRKCQRVIFSGSGCPDDLGDSLVTRGVNLGTFWGASEMGGLGGSFNRPAGDKTWDYIRIPPPVAKFIWMKPLGDDTYECVYLHGLPALVASNSDDPPKSFHSKDIFLKHPEMDAWKHIGRLDDRLTLSNGEKVLPVPMEGRIRQDPLIRECCVFGAGKSAPGILIFRNENSNDMCDGEFIDSIWPTIQHANAHAESFSHISKESIIPFSAETEFPKTDKESIKRAHMYVAFAPEIDALYKKLQNTSTGTLRLSISDLQHWLMKNFREVMGVNLSNQHDDFFAAGLNSLQAIQMRGSIMKNLDIGGTSKELGQNVIFDTGNVVSLAKHLYDLRTNATSPEADRHGAGEIDALIKKYSAFKKKHVVILTGATGSLGAHILAQLLHRSDVRHVYCLVRGDGPQTRVLQALRQRQLSIPDTSLLTALTSDLSKVDLGLSSETYKELQSRTTIIIHSAWAVNFKVGLSSFEPHLEGIHNLTQLSLAVTLPTPARLFFCSSIAAALNASAPVTISEAPIHDLEAASPYGYAQSKLIAEHIIRNAAIDAGARTRTFRIGQIVGDSQMGLWNDTEVIPLIIRSSLTLGVLPALEETQSWLPVDTVASIVLDLAGITAPVPTWFDSDRDLVYNIISRKPFSWTHDLLPELQRSGLSFSVVPVSEWIRKLRNYEQEGGDPERNPAVKLIDHFEQRFDGAERKTGEITFASEIAEKYSKALREAPEIIEGGYVKKFVDVWLEKWQEEDKGMEVISSG